MKKAFILGIIVLMFCATVIAQPQLPKPKIKKLWILGSGLVISPSDPKVFKIAKFGLAKITVSLAGEETDLKVGILRFDNETYKIKDITVGNDTANGTIYSNNTQVGTFELSSVIKNKLVVWVGTFTINDETWNAYFMEAPRKVKPIELAEHVSTFCKEHPEKCKRYIKGIGPEYCEKNPEEPSCREKIKNWCKDHSTDTRCIALLRNYCRFNMDDIRCREEFREYCSKHPEDEKCKYFELKITEKFCEKHPLDRKCLALEKKRIVEYCLDHPNETKCQQFRIAKEFRERVRFALYCRNNPTDEKCEDFCEVHPLVCQKPPEVPNVTAVSIDTIIKKLPAGSLGPMPLR